MPQSKSVKFSPAARRTPVQGRAGRTVETFFQAIAQISESDGDTSLSTNKIAEKAGFSIGTLYQYFPSAEALMFAMIKRDRGRVQQKLAAVLAKAELHESDAYQLIKEFIHILVQSYAGDQKLRRTMVRIGWQMDQGESMVQLNRETSDRLAVALARFSARATARETNTTPKLRMQPATLFAVTRAVSGVIRSASLEEFPLIASPEFEAGLVKLAWGMLKD